jgi:hypothetical protein
LCCRNQAGRIILELPQPEVAAPTEKAAHNTCFVVVIDDKVAVVSCRVSRVADCTTAALKRETLLILLHRQAMPIPQSAGVPLWLLRGCHAAFAPRLLSIGETGMTVKCT